MKKLFYLLILLFAVVFASCESKEPVSEVTGMENGHEYVDLGLSVKWATMNVGATSPNTPGDYFAWGETKPKDYYDWSSYKLCKGDYNNLIKYCTDSNYGTVDNKVVLDIEDDAANANWGGQWRMPTIEELQELLDNCTWTWDKNFGCYKVTSKINEKFIFLPLSGCRYKSELNIEASYGDIWSSTLNKNHSYSAHIIDYFSQSGADKSLNYRNYGRNVRPVMP